MLRGAIDYATSERIGGWIFSSVSQVREATVLAFLDDRCVGAGAVDMFRQDLADAGLGDGVLGFNFPISLPNPEESHRVTVKLEGSDFALVQPGARIAGAEAPAVTAAPAVDRGRSPASIEWMRGRGWLAPAEFDFLRMLQRLGVYDHALRPGEGPAEAAREAQRLLELYCLEDVRLVEIQGQAGLADLIRGRIAFEDAAPVVAIWSGARGVAAVVEGSAGQAAGSESAGLAGAIDHNCGPDRLLFLNMNGRLSLDELVPDNTRIFIAAPGSTS